jgi:glycosyltransferase involved in cell wall biosynthesis
MKISIITVCRNSASTIRDSIESVLSQTYPYIEYIIIDGASRDTTLEIIREYGSRIAKVISEPDKGLYDAMNKGIALATGDVIGILNSDDFYMDSGVIERVAAEFEANKTDSVYADLVYVRSDDLNKVVRYYDSSYFSPERFAYGWMPAHPTFFVKKWVYDKYGVFRTDLKIGADFDLLARLLYKHSISYSYMQEVLVKMRMGGVSTSLSSLWIISKEQLKVCRDNGINTNIFKILSRYPAKLLGVFRKKDRQVR